MPIFSSSIQTLVAGKMSAPYYDFDGSNDSMTLDGLDLNNTNAGSIEFMLRESNSGDGVVFIAKASGGNDVLIMVDDGAYIALRSDGNKVRCALPDDGGWHHYVGTADGSAFKIYIDGVSQTLTVSYGSNNGAWFNDMTGSFTYYLGMDSGSAYLNGSLARFRIWDTALSEADVKKLYAGEEPEAVSSTYDLQGTPNWDMGGDTYWSPAGNNTVSFFSSPDALHGTRICKITNVDSAGNSGADNMRFNGFQYNHSPTLSTSTEYVITIWARTISGDNSLNVFPEGFTNNTIYNFALTSDFKAYKITSTCTSVAVSQHLKFYLNNGRGEWELDAVSVAQSSETGLRLDLDGTGVSTTKWYDKSSNQLQAIISGATLKNESDSIAPRIATGGRVSFSGTGETIPQFYASGTFTCNQDLTAEVFVLAGGGSGCRAPNIPCGGGGAGGAVEHTSYEIPAGSYTVLVGAGGAKTGYYNGARQGGDSSFKGIVAKGGGVSAFYSGYRYPSPYGETNYYSPTAGGCGGGGTWDGSTVPSTGGAATANTTDGGTGYGYAGGTGSSYIGGQGGTDNFIIGGGGGGIGAVGDNYVDSVDGGDGGDGRTVSINSSDYGGGGGAGSSGSSSGGMGGGGAGGSSTAGDGSANRGGGGGSVMSAGYNNSTTHIAGSGGSGTVIIKYTTG